MVPGEGVWSNKRRLFAKRRRIHAYGKGRPPVNRGNVLTYKRGLLDTIRDPAPINKGDPKLVDGDPVSAEWRSWPAEGNSALTDRNDEAVNGQGGGARYHANDVDIRSR
jgi:hypothetical protein